MPCWNAGLPNYPDRIEIQRTTTIEYTRHYTEADVSNKRKLSSKVRNRQNRYYYQMRRRNWTLTGGPVTIADEPDDEHVKGLLMEFVKPLPEKKKLTAKWTAEREQDLVALTGLNAQMPLTYEALFGAMRFTNMLNDF